MYLCSSLTQKADTFLMVIVNSLAVLYLYNQFMSLRKTGSKYLLSESTTFDMVVIHRLQYMLCTRPV